MCLSSLEGKILFRIVRNICKLIYILNIFSNFNLKTLVYFYTRTSLTEFAVHVCLYIYLPDDDLVEVETCGKDVTIDN